MIDTIRLGYFIAAILYFGTGVLLLLNRRQIGGARTAHLSLLLLCTAVAYSAYLLLSDKFQLLDFLPLHLAQSGLLILLLLRKSEPEVSFWQLIRRPINLSVLLGTFSLIIVELSWQRWPLLTSHQIYFLHLVQMLVGLLTVERLWRTRFVSRWEIKPITVFAIGHYTWGGLLFAFAVLSGTFYSMFFHLMGWVMVLAAPLLALDIRRESGAHERALYMSREVVYSGSMLLFLGLFLLLLSLGYSYVVELVDGDYLYFEIWLLAAVIAGGSLFLMKSRLRRELKVFIGKNFYTNKYDYRQEWLAFTNKLTTDGSDIYSRSLASLMQPFDAKMGILFIIDGEQVIRQCRLNDGPDVDFPHELAIKLISQRWILDAQQVTDAELARFGLSVTQLSKLQPYTLFVPFCCEQTRGVFALSHPQTVFDLDYEDRDFLNVLASHIAVNLHLEQTFEKLNQSRQFESFHRMSAFVLHDLKNVAAQLDLIMQNAQAHRHNPEFIDDTFETISSASERLHKTVTQLTNKQVAADGAVEIFELPKQIEQALKHCDSGGSELSFVDNSQGISTYRADKERFTHVISHLVTNALQAVNGSQTRHKVQVEFISGETSYTIKIADNGIGMSQEFIQHKLFQPFYTTKGNSGMGIGAFEAKSYVESLGGKVQVQSQPNLGTEFSLQLPKSA